MTQSIIQTEHLSKRYGASRLALDDLTLRIEAGEIFGYLGPNGAGKTTTIRLLLDLIRPTAGSAQVFGLDAHADSVAIRRRIGFLPGELNLWDTLTAREIVRYLGRLRGGVDMRYVAQLAERFQFDLNKKVRSYSTGNKRKLGLILALMNRPELLILDEPTSGLDPLMQQEFNQIMRETRAEGRTVFLSSHVLSEVQSICDRVGILRNGQLQAVESIAALTRVDFRYITFTFRESAQSVRLDGLPGVSDVQVAGHTLRLRLHGDFDPVLRAVAPLYVQDVRVHEPTLEDIFLTYYGDATDAQHGRPMMDEAALQKAGVS